MTPQHLRDFEPLRRHATLTAVVLDTRATLIDELIDMHDRIMASKENVARRKHAEQFQSSGKQINEQLKVLSRLKSSGYCLFIRLVIFTSIMALLYSFIEVSG
ncbi:hypothetical protein [Shewanella gaetbuli]|uniref:Uncharacterized protein n=1 Tax=Shewanella gaetbuli TaxID=220752 RepID=A0A9X1ZMF7_9GAMM|nr:hypothetical protein [Shewanella gaetbuli]MCL1142447.1 hypothetical protein [Shewanella gaetbuli]